MHPFFAIARLTALEAIRRPVFLLITVFCLAGTTLMPLLVHFTLGDTGRIIRDSSLALYFVCGLLLAAYVAGDTLSRELEKGTAAVALSKPVPRTVFFLAKAAGIIAALLLFSILVWSAILLSARTAADAYSLDRTALFPALTALLLAPACAGWWNHRTQRPFTSAAFFLLLLFYLLAFCVTAVLPVPDTGDVFPHNLPWPVLSVGLLLFLALCMAAALAAVLATYLPLTPVLLLCTSFFMAGLLSDYFLGPHLAQSTAAKCLYAFWPNLQVFWLVDALDSAGGIPAVYLAGAAAYASCWSAACLLIGLTLFNRREIP